MRTTVAVFLTFIAATVGATKHVCPVDLDGFEVGYELVSECSRGGVPDEFSCEEAEGLSTIDGDWSIWGEWKEMQYEGATFVTRNRSCTNPAPDKECGGKRCRGPSSQIRPCSSPNAMKRNGYWTNWSEWSRFDTPRGSPGMTRTRACTDPPPDCGGDYCAGSDYEVKVCVDCAEAPTEE